jgi:hypothetical protein
MAAAVKRSYGDKFSLLTPTLARRLSGTTVPSLSGQRWMDFMAGSKRDRERQVQLLTVHGVFVTTPKKQGLFGSSSKPQTTCVVSVVGPGGKTNTFQTFLSLGHFGSGSGHDPVFVFST